MLMFRVRLTDYVEKVDMRITSVLTKLKLKHLRCFVSQKMNCKCIWPVIICP